MTRFRVNTFNQKRGSAAVFRTIPSKVLSLKAPSIFKDIVNVPRGLVLVTEPTGSGIISTKAGDATLGTGGVSAVSRRFKPA